MGQTEPPLPAAERELVDAVLAAAGIDSRPYRTAPLRRRLPALLRALRAPDPATALQHLRADPRLTARGLDTLLIGHTEAFRDREAFAALRERVLPELATPGRSLRIWSVACSTGVELLSVAALRAERGLAATCVLRGSDCRASALSAARRHAADPLAALADRSAPASASAASELRAAAARISWHVEDALTAPVEAPWDLILCRNLAIYLDAPSAERLWERLTGALAPRGVLMIGKAERPGVGLPLVHLAKCIYRREGARA
ncbi:MAG TPA: CheR family methyltransferase [Lacipirellulaceae bacterium]|nr:CheR family methyltransferase [Lacipirellulaceae bacterium]